MKKILEKGYQLSVSKLLSSVAALALMVTTVSVNSACWYVMNQDELPDGSKQLRKF